MIASIFSLDLIRPVFAAATCDNSFFFLPNWWEYLPKPNPPACEITFVFPGDVWLVGLAVLDMLLRLAGFVAVISIIIAGFQLQFSGGNPEKAAAARKRVLNSIYGLVIALVATAVVTYIGGRLAP